MSNPNPDDPPIPPISELKGAFNLNTAGLENYDAIAGSIEEEANRVFGLDDPPKTALDYMQSSSDEEAVDIPYMTVRLMDCADYLPKGVKLEDIDLYDVAQALSDAFMETWEITMEAVLQTLYGKAAQPGPAPDPAAHTYTLYECGICESFHPWSWNGDCRDDEFRYASVEDFCQATGIPEEQVVVLSWGERVQADLGADDETDKQHYPS